ncbi:efflux RND transporter periplasmic adaptor subunit [Planctobacterium marinum]|uniref:efflux RND transporter periplasmic adaptor subunit n=1 Tax=Planctobacterium marinum TaxID=1631968 RepID=UPI001E3FE3EB|nr:efflux RND transporter periplasmic adaptor subunit [Planctobacterium marinum]MCC2604212.1 efflux RND transporter periplasmic adaptor subunit [Planctobacterium marinum]
MKAKTLSLSLLFSLISCSEVKPPPEPAIRPITWVQAEPSSFKQIRRLSGTIQPVEATNLSFEVGGKIKTIDVDLGDRIQKGQIIARLDQRTYRLSLQSAEANLQQAKSSLSEAQNEFTRYKELIAKGLVSASGFDNVKAAFESAESAVNIAQAQLDIARKDLADTELEAPYDGTVTKRLAEPSMQISPGQAIFEIEGTDGLEVKVMVPETLISRLNKEVDVAVSFPALPGMSNTGTITELGSRAESANAFPVNVFVLSPPKELRAGMTAEVDFSFQGAGRTGYSGDIFRLPIAAIMPGQGQTSYIFVFDPTSQTVSKRLVQTENIYDNQILVSTGLEPGEIVATAGVNYLQDGQTVKLLDKHVQQYN